METILISFLYLCLTCAFIILVAFAVVWICSMFGVAIDGNVYKIGKVIVMLLILIAVVTWIFSIYPVVSGGGLGYRRPLVP
ncbi:MAG: hypothetical protein JWP25_8974 [Bradyrhizobium sp.]|nr:hypothetical protein [Bradyrhizobium sp.]